MKCKPKRISKKFEGISYNGRLTYQRSKQPISLEQATAIRARLSELERRYLAASAAQEGKPGSSSEGGATSAQQPSPGTATAFAGGGHHHHHHQQQQERGGASAFVPAAGGLQGRPATDRRNSGLGLGLLKTQDQQGGGGNLDLSRFQQQQSRNDLDMAEALMRNRDSSLNFNPSNFNPSLLSAAAGGNNLPGNANSFLSNNQLGSGGSAYQQLPQGLSMQTMLSEYQSHLRDKEQQQHHQQHHHQQQQHQQQQQQQQQHLEVLKMQQQQQQQNASDPASALAMQLRERSFVNSIAQLSRSGSGGYQMTNNSNNAEYMDANAALAHHNLDLNRYVLQSPQDDTTYFQQRLLPSMSASTHASNPGLGYGMGIMAAHATPATDGRRGSIAEYLKRQLQQGKDESNNDSIMNNMRPTKRQR